MATISSLGAGSGLDLSGLLDQLRDAERAKLQPITAQQERQETRISALGKLQSSLTTFQDSVAKLEDGSLFENVAATGGGDILTPDAQNAASPGNYNVEVTQLARAGTLATQRVDAPDQSIVDADGTLNLNFSSGNTVSVDVSAGSTLNDIRDAVNATDNAGVSASVINDGEGYRLSLNSDETGADAAIASTNFSDTEVAGGNLSATPDTEITQAGLDAELSINGVAISSTTNQVEGAIEGVTLDLEATGTTTVSVAQDAEGVREAASEFVSSFNSLKDTIGDLTAYNASTDEAGALNGDRTPRTVESRLRGDLSEAIGQGDLNTLNEVGISLQRDGKLELDEEAFNDQVDGNIGALSEFFVGPDGNGGFAGRIGSTVEELVGTGGLVSRAVDSAESQLDRLDDRFARREESVENTVDRFRSQFSQLDSVVAELNQTRDYLAQQLSGLGG